MQTKPTADFGKQDIKGPQALIFTALADFFLLFKLAKIIIPQTMKPEYYRIIINIPGPSHSQGLSSNPLIYGT